MEAYERLEQELAVWLNSLGYSCGRQNVVVCSSGTAALHLALEAFQLPLGSEVIVPDFTMVACARAVTLAGLTPAFVDCDERLSMDFDLMPMTKPYPVAVIAVHLYGRRCAMEWFDGMEEDKYTEHRTYLIEDLAEAHGVKPYHQTDAACYSFYRNKIIAGEEGGAVVFKDVRHADLARQLRSLGFTEAHDFNHVPRGHNYRLANLLANEILNGAQGLRFPVELRQKQRREIESWYNAACPSEWRMPARDVVWVYDLRIPGMTYALQSMMVRQLNEMGIAARHAFKPMHTLAEYEYCRVVGGYNSLRASQEVIYLPVQPGVTSQEYCRRAFKIVKQVVGSTSL